MINVKRSIFLFVIAGIFFANGEGWAQSKTSSKSLPAKKLSATKSTSSSKASAARKKKMQYISGEGAGSKSANFNSDSTEGWIVKRTKDGKIIKIPRKQTFKFGGSEVSAEANRPNETLLGSRVTPKAATLIPERRSYRKEILSTVGFQERNNNR